MITCAWCGCPCDPDGPWAIHNQESPGAPLDTTQVRYHCANCLRDLANIYTLFFNGKFADLSFYEIIDAMRPHRPNDI